MCWSYKGVDYDYAFEFKVPISGSSDERPFRIVSSGYRENTGNFSGLCLDNELKVISTEEFPFLAFYDIIDKVIKYTFSDENAYSETHSGNIPSPLMKVEDKDFLEKFEERKNSIKSIEYYKQLKNLFEKPDPCDSCEKAKVGEIKQHYFEYIEIMLFYISVYERLPNIKDVKAFKI